MTNPRWRWYVIIFVVLYSILWSVPSLINPVPSWWAKYLPEDKVSLGLDLQGGTHLVLEVDLNKKNADVTDNEAVEMIRDIIERRVNAIGLTEPVIQRQGKNRLIVELAGVKDPKRAKNMIGRTAKLEFRLLLDDADPNKPESYAGRGVVLEMMRSNYDKSTTRTKVVVSSEVLVSGADITNASVNFDVENKNEPYVTMEFNSKGADGFANLTGNNVGKALAIVLDDTVYSAPRINERIGDGRAQISGGFKIAEARDLAVVLRSGALPAPVKIVEDRTIGASLGDENIQKGLYAVLLGFVLIVAFMFAYYRLSGAIANVALIMNLLILLAVLAAFGATLTLPGIAGIILTVGTAVDANVLIFERIREELASGKSVRQAITKGYDKAFVTITDANITTLLTAGVLFQFGTGPVKGFAVTVFIGILASMFTALFVTKTIYRAMSIEKLTMGSIFVNSNYAIIEKRNIAYAVSAVLLLISIGSMVAKGGNRYSIDFLGGELYQIHFQNAVEPDVIRTELHKGGIEDAVVQSFGSENEIIIRVKSPDDVEQATMETAKKVEIQITRILDQVYAGNEHQVVRTEFVGPSVGEDLKVDALYAIVLALIMITIYISWRFELKYALGAIAALVHDVTLTLGVFSLLDKEISLTIIAAILFVIGYSLNDTIVVFDRVRENIALIKRKFVLADVVNRSVNESLGRTVVTSVTTLISVLCLFFSGSKSINDFSLALLIGVVVGTYSSAFIASPVIIEYDKHFDSN